MKTTARENLFHQHLQSDRASGISRSNFLFLFFGNHATTLATPPHQRGVSRSSRTWRRDAVGASDCSVGSSCADERPGAHGQAVWSWHPGADAKSATFLTSVAATGARKPVPGESAEDAVKTIAQGRPDVSARTCGDCRLLFFCRRAMGAVSIRPSLRPLSRRGRNIGKARTRNAPRGCGCVLPTRF
jgi:hypothetical protein